MANFVKDRYNELLSALRHQKLPHNEQAYDEQGLNDIAAYYFAKGEKTEEAKNKAQEAISRFVLIFDREKYNDSYSLQRERAAETLADFLYYFHTHAAVKYDLTHGEGFEALKKLANDVINKTSIRDDGRAACFQRLNFNRKVERILSFQANDKAKSHLDNFVSEFNTQVKNSKAKDKPNEISTRDEAYLFASDNFSVLFEVFMTDKYSHNERVQYIKSHLDEVQTKTHLIDFFNFIESQNHPDMDLEFAFARGKFYKVIRTLSLQTEQNTDKKFRDYRELTSYFIAQLPEAQQTILGKVIQSRADLSVSPKALYQEIHPEQLKRPKGMPASAMMIVITSITYGIRKVASWLSFSLYEFSAQKDVRAWLSREKRHYYAENLSFNSMKPAVFWGMTGTIIAFAVFGGLATFGVLPLTMTIPLFAGFETSFGILLTSIIPLVGSITGSIAGLFYKDEAQRSVEDEIDFQDMHELVAKEREALVLKDDTFLPSVQPVIKNDAHEDEPEDELQYKRTEMVALKQS